MTLLVNVEKLSRHYDQHCAVNSISFTLAKGEVLGFLGPNGAGKTTTMQMLTGNLAPTSGNIEINGMSLQKAPILAKRNIGYLPDTPPLYKDLSVNEFLRYCAQLHDLPKKLIEQAMTKAKQRCGLEDVAERLIQNLSKGFQQRLGIAQAILHNPLVIILDEPTVGLDPLQIREIRSLIRELGKDHGIILSTHILSEVQESCTHVQIIHQGSLILKQSIAELNQQMHASTLLIRSRLPMDIAQLNSIPGVLEIDLISPQRIRLSYTQDDSSSIADQIAQTILDKGWGLLEITPLQPSLEDIFVQVTREPASVPQMSQSYS